MLSEQLSGRVVRIEDDSVSTDVIAPTFWVHQGRGEARLDTLAPHAFESVRPGLHDMVRPGDIFVVGRNFGNGSHREEAVRILQVWGVSAVIAESAARIYFRNAIAAGLPLLQVPGALAEFSDGDEARVDFTSWVIENVRTGWSTPLTPLPPTLMRILRSGGIAAVVREQMRCGGRANHP